MATRVIFASVFSFVLLVGIVAAQQPVQPFALASGSITIAGTSNVHSYSATTSAVRIARVQVGVALSDPRFLEEIVKPGAIAAFDIAIPVTTMASGKSGLDKNMHKALKAEQHPEIAFRLAKLQATASAGTLRATGILKIAGVERELSFDLNVRLGGGTLTVTGEVPLVMTDYGIAPPKAMLGMLKTDPKVTVTFETVLTVPPSAAGRN
jgi:polyisoprenoid-binding protein YceI